MAKYFLMAVVAVGVLSASATFVTRALFSAQEAVGLSTFVTGTVDIAVAPVTSVFSVADMAPGDSPTGTITVTNGGSLQFRYGISASATNPDGINMRSALRVRIGVRGGVTCDFPYFNPDGTARVLTDDTQIYLGTGLPAAETDIVGSKVTGQQTGDRVVNAGANEALCFAVNLPLTAGNEYQTAATDASITFFAEQSANNP